MRFRAMNPGHATLVAASSKISLAQASSVPRDSAADPGEAFRMYLPRHNRVCCARPDQVGPRKLLYFQLR
jgi:hypothetical protein